MTEPTADSAPNYPPDVHCLKLGDREIFLIGTAHISRESVELVRQVIAGERPDCVCVELDEKRYEALRERSCELGDAGACRQLRAQPDEQRCVQHVERAQQRQLRIDRLAGQCLRGEKQCERNQPPRRQRCG